ncbi:MAG: hypothetical protein ACRC80_18315 [Waterburya sp.]
MPIERIGYLGYKLYCLGWHNAVHKNLNPIEHSLFNALLYYRRGFKEGLASVKANYLEEIRH